MSAESGKQKTLRWELKDAGRHRWYIRATPRGTVDSTDEEGYYETHWSVTVRTDRCSPDYRISFTATTQYDLPIMLTDIWREIRSHLDNFTEAALVREGRDMEREA